MGILLRIARWLNGLSGQSCATHNDILNAYTLLNMKLSQLKVAIDEIKAQAEKANEEVKSELQNFAVKLAELESQLADQEIPSDAQQSLDDLKSIIVKIDELVADKPTEPQA